MLAGGEACVELLFSRASRECRSLMYFFDDAAGRTRSGKTTTCSNMIIVHEDLGCQTVEETRYAVVGETSAASSCPALAMRRISRTWPVRRLRLRVLTRTSFAGADGRGLYIGEVCLMMTPIPSKITRVDLSMKAFRRACRLGIL